MNHIVLIMIVVITTSLQAQADPLTEFVSGDRNSYSSLSNPKAKGIQVTFEYPESWSGADAKRPNMLYQVTSENGKGLEVCNLGIRHLDINPSEPITKDEIENMFVPSGLKAFLAADSVFVSGKRTKIDGQPAAQIQFRQKVERAGIKMQLSGAIYPAYFRNSFVIFTCFSGSSAEKSNAHIDQRYRIWFPLFQQMANSIVIHSGWKKE